MWILLIPLAFLQSTHAQYSVLPARPYPADILAYPSWAVYVVSTVFIVLVPVIVLIILLLVSFVLCVVYHAWVKNKRVELTVTEYSVNKYAWCFALDLILILITTVFTIAVIVFAFILLITSIGFFDNFNNVGKEIVHSPVYSPSGFDDILTDSFFGMLKNYSIYGVVIFCVSSMIIVLLGMVLHLGILVCFWRRIGWLMGQCKACVCIVFVVLMLITACSLLFGTLINDGCGHTDELVRTVAGREMISTQGLNGTGNSFARAAVLVGDYCISDNQTIKSGNCDKLYKSFTETVCRQTVVSLIALAVISVILGLMYFCMFSFVAFNSKMFNTEKLRGDIEKREEREAQRLILDAEKRLNMEIEKGKEEDKKIEELEKRKSDLLDERKKRRESLLNNTKTIGDSSDDDTDDSDEVVDADSKKKKKKKKKKTKRLRLARSMVIRRGGGTPEELEYLNPQSATMKGLNRPKSVRLSQGMSDSDSSDDGKTMMKRKSDSGDNDDGTEDGSDDSVRVRDSSDGSTAEKEGSSTSKKKPRKRRGLRFSCLDYLKIVWYFIVFIMACVLVSGIVVLVLDILSPPVTNYYIWGALLCVPAPFLGLTVIVYLLYFTKKCAKMGLCNKMKYMGSVSAQDVEMLKLQKDNEKEKLRKGGGSKVKLRKDLFNIRMKNIKLKKEIGSGGSDTTVYLADWKGTTCAVKVFSSVNLMQSPEDMESFEREVRIAAKLKHPNILQFYGLAFQKPRIGIVMEFCSKGDLAQYLFKSNRGKLEKLKVKEKFRILQEICLGLIYMHDRKIVHRDMKTLNVLLSESLTAKIIDFGLSKVVKKENANKMTRQIGTAYYMAPELTLGSSKYDGKVDVFAFSLIMFETLTEKFDYYGDDNNPSAMIELKVARNPEFRPKIKDDQYGPKFKWYIKLMKMCWEHSPDDRPSFTEVKKRFLKNVSKCEDEELVDKYGDMVTKKKSKAPKKKKKKKKKKDTVKEEVVEITKKKKKKKESGKKKSKKKESDSDDDEEEEEEEEKKKKKKKEKKKSGKKKSKKREESDDEEEEEKEKKKKSAKKKKSKKKEESDDEEEDEKKKKKKKKKKSKKKKKVESASDEDESDESEEEKPAKKIKKKKGKKKSKEKQEDGGDESEEEAAPKKKKKKKKSTKKKKKKQDDSGEESDEETPKKKKTKKKKKKTLKKKTKKKQKQEKEDKDDSDEPQSAESEVDDSDDAQLDEIDDDSSSASAESI